MIAPRTPDLLRRSRSSLLAPLALFACVAGVVPCSAVACSETAPDVNFDPPDRTTFPPVLDAFERRCATLDCHGAPGRNLRLYTGSGLRLNPKDVPGSGSTTKDEYDASYWSVVGLEPEVISQVVADGGANPERLTMVRKARGTEHHRPGPIIKEGDDADRCLTSWLAGKLDKTACKNAASFGPPDPGTVPTPTP
jgi:hypothetical protein